MGHVALTIALIIAGSLFGCSIVSCFVFWLASMHKHFLISVTCTILLTIIMWMIGMGL